MTTIDPSEMGKRGGKARAEKLTSERKREIARAGAEARWTKALPRATHDGTLRLGNLELPCAVLDNGTRVISQRALAGILGASRGGHAYAQRELGGADLPVFLAVPALKRFIDNDLVVALSPVEYVPLHGGRSALGLQAETVPKVCEVWLRARDADALTRRQIEIAREADILLRGLAHVGITALIDEATGYQLDREGSALAKILERFIAKELRPWVKTFPPDYYREIYRLRAWPWPPKSNTHNSVLGKYTNDIVYDRLAPGVKDALHRLTPRNDKGRLKHQLHRRLTEDLGHPKLREHLGAVVMAMKLSKTWDDFMGHLNRLLPKWPKVGETQLLPYGGSPSRRRAKD